MDRSLPPASARPSAAGDVATANALLGHPWLVSGEVIRGKQLGRTLGYPTANVALPPETDLAHGIYAVRATADDATHDGVASFGRRPTFDNGAVLLETFVFDFFRRPLRPTHRDRLSRLPARRGEVRRRGGAGGADGPGLGRRAKGVGGRSRGGYIVGMADERHIQT